MDEMEDGDSPSSVRGECKSQLISFSRSNWNDKNNFENLKSELIQFFVSNINNGFSRIENKTLVESLSFLPLELLKCLRIELGDQLLANHNIGATITLKQK
ncbi:hypothetical protein BpHYR1_025909 [Brachionus plicatilis]|uniref:Uncharacterized protein n=1 Tax=Brachionus plicatilis TaxID=10195 RepID=A0A3M7QVD2_BRAPC|nr:hypothetical protein BpHYR1_025909 [Brachionus plicatilis]